MEENKVIDTVETMSQDVEDQQTPSKPEFSKVTSDMILAHFGPKRAFRQGLLLSTSGGWREGYTKRTLADRTLDRRRVEKNKRKVKQAQRKAGQRCTN